MLLGLCMSGGVSGALALHGLVKPLREIRSFRMHRQPPISSLPSDGRLAHLCRQQAFKTDADLRGDG